MLTMRSVALLSVLILGTRVAAAQDVFELQVPPMAAAQAGDAIFIGQPAAPGMGLLAVEPFDGGKPIVGAPYSADAITTSTQLLANGNRIDNEVSAMVARDSRGRTRREHQALFLGALVAERQAALVTITDPVAGTHLTLDQERRIAFRARTRTFTVATRGPAGVPLPPNTASGEFNVVIGQGIGGVEAGSVAGVRAGAGVQAAAVAGEAVTTQLGEKEIEGVRVTGTMTTMTIPAERIGNQFPIEIVSERWYSPELQVVVMTRRSDPRFGETVYRLTNIVRAEPPQSLFEIPPGFRIEQMGPPAR